MTNSLSDYMELLNRSMDVNGGVPERHERHYAAARNNRSNQFWHELTTWAEDRHDIDLDEIADRGEDHAQEVA